MWMDTTHNMAREKGENNERRSLKMEQSKALNKTNLAGLTR
jgi:hypothetical protein